MVERIGRHLASDPQVGAKIMGLHLAGCGVVDRGGEGAGANMKARRGVEFPERPQDSLPRNATDAPQLGGGIAFGHRDLSSHALKCPTFRVIVKGESPKNGEIVDSVEIPHDSWMGRPKKARQLDPWKQRDRFLELLDAKVAEGFTLEEIAEALGLPSTNALEKKYRYDHSRIPKRQVLEKAAGFFGVPMAGIYGSPIDEAIGPDLSSLSPAKLLLARSIVRKFSDPNVSEERAEKIWKAIESLVEAGTIK